MLNIYDERILTLAVLCIKSRKQKLKPPQVKWFGKGLGITPTVFLRSVETTQA